MTRRIDMRMLLVLAPLGVVGALACERVATSPDEAALDGATHRTAHDEAPPRTLAETGLYADPATKTLAPGVMTFAPQYPLWTDGATKRRFLALPPGTFIDARDPEAWRFPIGTRIWKEFSFGRRVETRTMRLGPDGWSYATYVWNDAESEAVIADAHGQTLAIEVAPGVPHVVPSEAECIGCHANATTPVLGFSLLQLSPDRDPNAPHADVLRPTDVDLRELVRRGLVRNLPSRFVANPPRIEARSATERAALGYLHGNCGSCHRRTGPLATLGMELAFVVGDDEPGARATTIGVPSGFVVDPRRPDHATRVVPGDPDASVLFARLRARDPVNQMPPLGTRLVDDEAVSLVARWIRDLEATQRPRTKNEMENEP